MPRMPTIIKAVRQSKMPVKLSMATGATPPPKNPENVCSEYARPRRFSETFAAIIA